MFKKIIIFFLAIFIAQTLFIKPNHAYASNTLSRDMYTHGITTDDFTLRFKYPGVETLFGPTSSGSIRESYQLFVYPENTLTQEEYNQKIENNSPLGGDLWIWWAPGELNVQGMLGNTVQENQGTEKSFRFTSGKEYIGVTRASIDAYIFVARDYTFAIIDPKNNGRDNISDDEWTAILASIEVKSPIYSTPSDPDPLDDGMLIKAFDDLNPHTHQDTTIYLLDNGTRRPFLNERIYKMYYSSFVRIHEISAEDIANIPLGKPMLPPATTWLKIQSLPNIYEVQNDGKTIRWIASEEVAQRLRGSTWNQNIETIDIILYQQFTIGDAIL